MLGNFHHLTSILYSVVTIFNEMVLPPADRVGPPLASVMRESHKRSGIASAVEGKRNIRLRRPDGAAAFSMDQDALQPSSGGMQHGSRLTADEELLAKVIVRHFQQGFISVRDVAACKSSLRNNQEAVARFFDYVEEAGLGQREGEPQAQGSRGVRGAPGQELIPLRFVFHADAIPTSLVDSLGLEAAGGMPPTYRYKQQPSAPSRLPVPAPPPPPPAPMRAARPVPSSMRAATSASLAAGRGGAPVRPGSSLAGSARRIPPTHGHLQQPSKPSLLAAALAARAPPPPAPLLAALPAPPLSSRTMSSSHASGSGGVPVQAGSSSLALRVAKRPAAEMASAAPKRGKPSGRPSQDQSPLSVCTSNPFGIKSYKTEEKFRQDLKAWASILIGDGKKISIRTHCLSHQSRFGIYIQKFWCGSCTACAGCRGWHGVAEYDTRSHATHIRMTEMSTHGNFDKRKGRNQLTDTERHAARQHVTTSDSKSTLDVVRALSVAEGKDQPAQKVRHFIKNFKKRTLKTKLPVPWSASVWRTCSWQRLVRLQPFLETAIQESSEQLCVVEYKLGQRDTVVVFCHVPLAREVLSRLGNKEYIKLCGDGTFRMMRDGWVLITLGVLCKHHTVGTSDHTACFRMTYRPFVFAIANCESSVTYGVLFEAAKKVALTAPRGEDNTPCPIDLTANWATGAKPLQRCIDVYRGVGVDELCHVLRRFHWHILDHRRPYVLPFGLAPH